MAERLAIEASRLQSLQMTANGSALLSQDTRQWLHKKLRLIKHLFCKNSVTLHRTVPYYTVQYRNASASFLSISTTASTAAQLHLVDAQAFKCFDTILAILDTATLLGCQSTTSTLLMGKTSFYEVLGVTTDASETQARSCTPQMLIARPHQNLVFSGVD